MSPAPLIYSEFAPWFHLLTAPADYAEEAAAVIDMLEARCATPPQRVLELGSGGGNLASHLRDRWEMTLTDLSPEMLALSQTINPECEHAVGDMRTLRLEAEPFDGVVVHDAILYMTTESDLRAAMATAYAHLRPGGAAIFLPDYVAETFEPETDCGGHDDRDGRGLRYLEWTFDRDLDDTTAEVVYAYLSTLR